jgi:hypothetical protein
MLQTLPILPESGLEELQLLMETPCHTELWPCAPRLQERPVCWRGGDVDDISVRNSWYYLGMSSLLLISPSVDCS